MLGYVMPSIITSGINTVLTRKIYNLYDTLMVVHVRCVRGSCLVLVYFWRNNFTAVNIFVNCVLFKRFDMKYYKICQQIILYKTTINFWPQPHLRYYCLRNTSIYKTDRDNEKFLLDSIFTRDILRWNSDQIRALWRIILSENNRIISFGCRL